MRLIVLTVLLSAVAFCIMSDNAQAQNISEEARRYLARGDAAMEMAKSSDEYAPAIEEYRKALGLEPRWPLAHHRLGIAYEKAQKITEAISCFSEYLSLSPNAPDADQMRDRIYRLEYRAEQALSVPEIIRILISLSNTKAWKKTGNCGTHLIEFRDARSGENDQVNVLTGFFLFGQGDTYKDKQVTGPLLEYDFIANTCPPGQHQRDWDCFGQALVTVEIASRNLVKVKNKSVRLDPNSYIPNGEQSCVFKRNIEERR